MILNAITLMIKSQSGAASTNEYELDSVDNHITLPAGVTVVNGDTLEFDFKAGANVAKVQTFVSKTTASSFLYTNSSGALRYGAGISTLLVDDVGYSDAAFTLVVGTTYHIKFTITGSYSIGVFGQILNGNANSVAGTMKNIALTRPSGTDLFWPVNDGWGANPTIAETAVGGGTWDGTAVNFVTGGWSVVAGGSLANAGPADVGATAGPRYGAGLSWGSLSNIKADTGSQRQFMSFRATTTSDVTSLRFYYLNQPGYGEGLPTQLDWIIEGDNGSSQPDGVSLGRVTITTGLDVSDPNKYVTWDTDRPSLVAGELYFLISENYTANVETDNYSIDYYQQLGFIEQHLGRWNPQWPNNEFKVGWTSLGSNTWTERGSLTAIFDLGMLDGTHMGIGYINTTYMDPVQITGTQKKARQSMTPTSDVTVTGGGLALSGSGEVTVELTNAGGTVLGTYTLPGTSFPVNNSGDSRDEATWEAGTFGSSITMTAGQTYYLVVSSPTGDVWSAGLRNGSGYSYHSDTYFNDGKAMYTTDGGTTWVNYKTWGSPESIIDLKFYLDTAV